MRANRWKANAYSRPGTDGRLRAAETSKRSPAMIAALAHAWLLLAPRSLSQFGAILFGGAVGLFVCRDSAAIG
jgi:hypothetical protein